MLVVGKKKGCQRVVVLERPLPCELFEAARAHRGSFFPRRLDNRLSAGLGWARRELPG